MRSANFQSCCTSCPTVQYTKPTACATAQRCHSAPLVTDTFCSVRAAMHAVQATGTCAFGHPFYFLKNWSHLHQALSNCQHASPHRVNQEQKRRFASQTPHPMPRANALTPSFRSAHRSRVYGELLRPKLRCVARVPSHSASQLCRRHSCPIFSKFILMRHSFSTRQAFTLILTIAGIATCTTK